MKPTTFKRGQRIEYTYAAGQVTLGKVVRLYTAKDCEQHKRTHGEAAAAALPEWIVCELTDAHGSYRGACHFSQLRSLDNRAA